MGKGEGNPPCASSPTEHFIEHGGVLLLPAGGERQLCLSNPDFLLGPCQVGAQGSDFVGQLLGGGGHGVFLNCAQYGTKKPPSGRLVDSCRIGT